MDQINNNPALAMLQNMAAQTQVAKTGKSDADSEFQKLMDKAASGQPDSGVEERPRTEKPAEAKKPVKADGQKKVQNPAEQSEEAAEQGYVVVGSVPVEALDITIVKDDQVNEGIGIPVGDGWVLVKGNQQIQTVFANAQTQPQQDGAGQPMDVSDPKADAMLEATAPGADNSPAAMLEKVVAEQTGQEIQPDAGEAQGQQKDDGDLELIDVEQAPQRIFHDVEAAPVKVGEVYTDQQVDEPDVVKQVDSQIAQALQSGESLVRIQITPENLGSVTVEISQSADGILRVALSAHNSETRSLLERHAGDLQGLLSSRNQQEIRVEVQRQSESQQNQNQQNYDGHNGHAQDGQERRQSRREHTSSQDFLQQLRLGLIPVDGEEI